MVAGVAGGVVGEVAVNLGGSTRAGSNSSWGGESDGSIPWGGCGNRESENVEGVVCAPLEFVRSVDTLSVAGGCFLAGGGDVTRPVVAGGRGNLFLGLK